MGSGDFLLARASVSLARLRDPYVTELLSLVIEHLVKGEIMQAKPVVLRAGRLWENLEYYMTKTYYKTASLIAHSCKAVAVLGGHNEAVQDIAYEFGKSIGLAFQVWCLPSLPCVLCCAVLWRLDVQSRLFGCGLDCG